MNEDTREKMVEAIRAGRIRYPRRLELPTGPKEKLDPELFETKAWNDYAASLEYPSVEMSKAVLDLFEANVVWADTAVDGEGNEHPMDDWSHWQLLWPFGTMALTPRKDHESWAIRMAARFIYLWLCGVKAWTADHLASFEATWLQILEEERDGEVQGPE